MKPLILITNDDGVFSPGLKAVAEAVVDLGDLLISAPRFQQTAMSRSTTYSPNGGIIEEVTLDILGKPQLAYGVHGSPVLSVIHGIFELAPRQPDLCISGINYGDNVGVTMAASGTIGAALEASTLGIPALAVSREAELHLHRSEDYAELDWQIPAYFTRKIAEKILKEGFPTGVDVLNLNIPDGATEATEIRDTIQSRQAYFYYTRPDKRDFSQGFVLSEINSINPATLEPNSDIQAFVFDRVVSLTPLTNNLTAPIKLQKWITHHDHQEAD